MWKNSLAALLLALAALLPGTAMADIFLSADFALTRGEDANSYEFTAAVPETVGQPRADRLATGLSPDRDDAPDERRPCAICL